MLLRMIEPLPSCAEGITVDGVGLHTIDRTELRSRFIAMSQDPVFLPGNMSIKRQLDPHGSLTPEECHAVLQLVELGALATTAADLGLPLHPDSLSGGQRQLFNLARAVLRRRARCKSSGEEIGGLLLLDEVTASMDHETERIMRQVILNEFEKYTIIMVSHRLEMVMDFDTVLVMEGGRVVERGAPEELAKDERSYFGQLWMAGRHEVHMD
jgi:ATP-binding cassette, subfamily C (CFTR/MRP), member 1